MSAVIKADVLSAPKPLSHAVPFAGNGRSVDESDSLYEIIDGRRLEKTISVLATEWTSKIHYFLCRYVLEARAGRATVESLFSLPGLNRERRPDVAYVSYSNWSADRPLPRSAAWPIAPDLAVEVVSPRNYSDDVVGKVSDYFASGAKQVWVVWPREPRLYLYADPDHIRSFNLNDTIDGGDLLPGFRLSMRELFDAVGTEEPAS